MAAVGLVASSGMFAGFSASSEIFSEFAPLSEIVEAFVVVVRLSAAPTPTPPP